MDADGGSEREAVVAAVDALKAGVKAVADLPLDQLTHPELLQSCLQRFAPGVIRGFYV